jgi:hypothetical protein
LITGPAGAEVALDGLVADDWADDWADALQPTRVPAAMSREAAPMTSLRCRDSFLAISTPAIRHEGICGWVIFQSGFHSGANGAATHKAPIQNGSEYEIDRLPPKGSKTTLLLEGRVLELQASG